MTLGALSAPEVAARGALVLAVPLGSCEQHGPHLPLWTDSLVAVELCARLARRRDDVVVAPALGVGASWEHDGFAGTLAVGTDQLAAFLTELVRSSRGWSRGTVLVSGHGGNLDALRLVERTAAAEGDAVCVYLPHVEGGDAHAGRTETSLVLALDATQVRHDEAVPGVTSPLRELAPRLRAQGIAAVSPNGVLGDPAGASAREGTAILEGLEAALLRAVDGVFGARP